MRAAVSQASTQQDSPTSNASDAEQLMPSAPDSDTYVPPGKRDTGTDRAAPSADGRRTAFTQMMEVALQVAVQMAAKEA